MDKKAILALILLLFLLFPAEAESRGPVLWLDASKDPVLPDIEITTPRDGETVDGIVKVAIQAEGYKLQRPTVYLLGASHSEDLMVGNCVFEDPVIEDPVKPIVEGTTVEAPPQRMFCTAVWDTISFAGEKVEITAKVQDIYGHDQDESTVLVSGDQADSAGNKNFMD